MIKRTMSRRRLLGGPLFVLLALLTGLDAMAIDLYLPGMPAISQALNVSPGRVQQTLSVFLVGLAVGQALYGPLLDRYGRRLPVLAALAVFVLGSMLAAIAPSIEWLLAARFIQALGAAGGLVAPRAVVNDLCSVGQSARIYSLLMQVMMIAPVVAPILGGYLLTQGSWPLLFWALALLGAATGLWALLALPDTLPRQLRAPLHASSIMRVYLRQLCQPAFLAYSLAGGFLLGSLFTYISSSAFVFTHYFSMSPVVFSYLFAANALALVAGGLLNNALLERECSVIGLLLMGIVAHTVLGSTLLALSLAGVVSMPLYVGLLGLAIGSFGLIFGNLTALTMSHAGHQAGGASALMGAMQYLVAGLIGYWVSLRAPGLAPLPAAMASCGLAALVFCAVAKMFRTGD